MKKIAVALLCAGSLISSGAYAHAQATLALAQATAVTLGGLSDNVLRKGTSIALELLGGLTTEGKKLHVGQRFQMEVADAVVVNSQIVIPVGSPAVGEITEVRIKGMWANRAI